MELLAVWPPAQLQQMLVAFWTITLAEDEWCFRLKDRSLYAFRHAAERLDRIAIARAAARCQPVEDPAWDAVVQHVADRINRHSFYSWFGNLRLMEDRDGVFVVEAPDDQVVAWIRKHYSDVLDEAVEHVRPGASVTFRARVSA